MLNSFSRTQLLLGPEGMKKLSESRVAVFGIGGVGGYAVEALARSGVGALDLIDDDKVCLTNINRQIIATRKTVGKYKVDVAEERIHDINPDCVVKTYKTFYMPDTASQFDFSEYDYVIDAIDTVTGKLELIEQAKKAGTPIISSMGAGNKLDPTAFEVTDLSRSCAESAKREASSPSRSSIRKKSRSDRSKICRSAAGSTASARRARRENARREETSRDRPHLYRRSSVSSSQAKSSRI